MIKTCEAGKKQEKKLCLVYVGQKHVKRVKNKGRNYVWFKSNKNQ